MGPLLSAPFRRLPGPAARGRRAALWCSRPGRTSWPAGERQGLVLPAHADPPVLGRWSAGGDPPVAHYALYRDMDARHEHVPLRWEGAEPPWGAYPVALPGVPRLP